MILVDMAAADRGHLLDDDLFLAECIAPLTGEFAVATSPASARNLREQLDVTVHEIDAFDVTARFPRIRMLRLALSLPCSRAQDVIFQSFEEVSALLFMLRHPGKQVHLIVTNGLCPYKFVRRPALKRFFLRAVLGRATSIIVHSQHEVAKIRELNAGIDPARIFVKPFHQLAFPRVRLPWQDKAGTILFLGPERAHKKVAPVIELIKKDKDRRYRYVFHSMKEGMERQTLAFLEAQENVTLSFGYTDPDAYYRAFSEAGLIILTHDEAFEGALSGVFCDAVASGTPVIARDMAPHREFFDRFGPMGFLVGYAERTWCEQVLAADLAGRYGEFQRNMAKCREACTMESNRGVFREVLSVA